MLAAFLFLPFKLRWPLATVMLGAVEHAGCVRPYLAIWAQWPLAACHRGTLADECWTLYLAELFSQKQQNSPQLSESCVVVDVGDQQLPMVHQPTLLLAVLPSAFSVNNAIAFGWTVSVNVPLAPPMRNSPLAG